ncbi:MAG: class I SAM-dependent methyltransferase [Steroidobacteraceae bacterium]
MKDVESQVREFYDREGWVIDDKGKTGEDRIFRDQGESRAAYDEKIKRRTVDRFDGLTGSLLIAGCGDLPDNHFFIAEKFAKVVCVDISWRALAISQSKLGARSEYHKVSILALPMPDESFDAVFCAHVLYHIDKKVQENAVRELIRVVKPGGRIVILYRNGGAPMNLLQRLWQACRFDWLLGTHKLYLFSYPRSWWSQFGGSCRIEIMPTDVLSPGQLSVFLPTEALRKRFFRWVTRFEDQHPAVARRLWAYSMIVLDKLPASHTTVPASDAAGHRRY